MDKAFKKRSLASKSGNISDWYNDVVVQAALADYSDVRGCMIIRPNGYAIWERTQSVLDAMFKKDGVQNAYFPLFIPYSLLQIEKEHLEGFSPELAMVEYAGGEKLAEPYAIRPTSETIMYKTFANWIKSYRDLPLKINQWCNVVRWEKRTHPFLRTTEFLWQEGHTAHRTEDEAVEMAMRALGWYKTLYEEYYAISVYAGIKSETEKFAGAKTTYSVELVIPDGKALQGATAHNLADNFSRVFNIEFLDEEGKKRHPFQTSWGFSTRAIGGLILAHGDDAGLILPPNIASTQVAVVVIKGKEDAEGKRTLTYATKIAEILEGQGLRVALDADTKHSLGYRINEWELRGIPLRMEIGSKELDAKCLVAVRRDTFEKITIMEKDAAKEIPDILRKIQHDLLNKSAAVKTQLTLEAATFGEFQEILTAKYAFIRAPWCEKKACEQQIKAKTKATTRVLELENIDRLEHARCVHCGDRADRKWLFAQSY